MPQKFQTERRYVNTFLKLLYYHHALRRFDKTKVDRAKDNLLILWADEAQRFMTASEDGNERLQLRRCNPGSRRHRRCRRTKHDLACSTARQRQIKSSDLEPSQPDDFPLRRRSRRSSSL